MDSNAVNLDTTKRVLVAEDNPNLRKVLVNIIKKIGYESVVQVEDGRSAWQLIELGKVDLVLSDWAMPEMDGIEILRKVRASKSPIKDIPFLMITAADTKTAIITAGKEGVDAYIIKPFSVKTVTEKIQEAINVRNMSG
ncbi:MAG: response regulator [Deltaproteobacteria bacterium]|nr:response regulator [Deltaproteobacteria bacterium]